MVIYLIDGNNVLGKIKSVHKKDVSREKLAYMIEKHFQGKNITVVLYYDGYIKEAIKVSGVDIVYSNKITADEKIKDRIEFEKNPRVITVVTSDFNLQEFAKVCRCDVVSSEEFSHLLYKTKNPADEDKKQNSISNDEMRRLFGI